MTTKLTILKALQEEIEKLISVQEYNLKIGKVIRKYRDAMGITQEDFSKLLKIPRNRLSNIENGNTSTSAHELHIIKNLLKIPQEELEVDKHTNKSDYNNSYFTNYELKAFLYLHSLNLSKEFLKLLIQLAKQAMKEGKE